MRKLGLIALAAIVIALPRLLELIGIGGTQDDLAWWGRLMLEMGLPNFIATACLVLALWLFWDELRERLQANIKSRVAAGYFPTLRESLFGKVLFFDPEHTIQCQIDLIGALGAVPQIQALVIQSAARGIVAIGGGENSRQEPSMETDTSAARLPDFACHGRTHRMQHR
ncbi:MAG: hypothetical protein WDZ83_12550 [Rhizobiaceae bacterium]